MPITQEATRSAKKLVGFRYLQSIAMMNDGLDLSKQVGVTSPSKISGATDLPNQSLATPGKTLYRIDAASDSGWQIDEIGQFLRRDRARFAIGIRDIYMGAASYEEAGQIVSLPYDFPGTIDSIQLLADEFLPVDFDRSKIWIRYYLVIASQFVEIAPSNRAYGLSQSVPTTIYFNRDPDQDDNAGTRSNVGPVSQLRIKFSLSRPGDAKGASPVVKGFRLKASLL